MKSSSARKLPSIVRARPVGDFVRGRGGSSAPKEKGECKRRILEKGPLSMGVGEKVSRPLFLGKGGTIYEGEGGGLQFRR